MTEEMDKDPRWGDRNRDKKAQTILHTITKTTNLSLAKTKWLDIGCGSGGISAFIAPYVDTIIGVDPESWVRWSEFESKHSNLKFVMKSVESLTWTDNSFDVIICNQVYEHVPEPKYLLSEIYRLLKPGRYCYFAGPNLLFPVEPHIFWPFIHWLPREFAISLLKICRSDAILDAYSVNYWKLQSWFKKFEVINALPLILKNPYAYGRSGFVWNLLACVPYQILVHLTCISPGFVFILRKPNNHFF